MKNHLQIIQLVWILVMTIDNSELDSIFPIKSIEKLNNLEDELKNKKYLNI